MSEREMVERLVAKARVLYEGKQVGHRSCGIALAETFARPTAPYQALRGGGITQRGPCGAALAGQLLLGEIFGDPDPAGPVTPALRAAMAWYQDEIERRVERGGSATLICRDLTGRFPVFQSEERLAFCTDIVAVVAEVLGEAVVKFGGTLPEAPIPPR